MSREHPLSLHRVLPALVVIVLCLVAVAWWRGPQWFQRLYHPLQYERTIERTAKARGVDPYLIAAMINVESGYNPYRVSKAGAVGLMQVMPATAREVAHERGMTAKVDTESLKQADTNITVGTAYVSTLMHRYDRNTVSVLAAYNGGLSNGDRWNARGTSSSTVRKQIDFPETKEYVASVLRERDVYRRLYPGAFEGALK